MKTRLPAKSRHRAEELEALFNISKTITSSLNVEEVLRRIVQETARLMKTRICSLMLLDAGGQELGIKAVHGGTKNYVTRPNLRVAETFVGKVIGLKAPVATLDVRKEPGYKYLELALKEGLCSLLSVPLVTKGSSIGVINVYKATKHRFSQDEVALASSVADLSAIAIENARLYEKVVSLDEQVREAEKLGVLGELSVELAHEIRNPLTVMRMLVHGRALSERDAEVIRDEIERMNKILTQFLEFARPKPLEAVSADIAAVLEGCLLLVEPKIRAKTIKVVKKIGEVPRVSIDHDGLTQVFMNIILNAVDAMSSGGRLEITASVQETAVVTEIADTGMGMPRSIRERAFERFVTTKKDGLGLGLSITRRIVRQAGGSISFKTRRRKGTSFYISLPACEKKS